MHDRSPAAIVSPRGGLGHRTILAPGPPGWTVRDGASYVPHCARSTPRHAYRRLRGKSDRLTSTTNVARTVAPPDLTRYLLQAGKVPGLKPVSSPQTDSGPLFDLLPENGVERLERSRYVPTTYQPAQGERIGGVSTVVRFEADAGARLDWLRDERRGPSGSDASSKIERFQVSDVPRAQGWTGPDPPPSQSTSARAAPARTETASRKRSTGRTHPGPGEGTVAHLHISARQCVEEGHVTVDGITPDVPRPWSSGGGWTQPAIAPLP